MENKKFNICLMIPSFFDPNMPSRSAITEIYGHHLPDFGHRLTWITASDGKFNYNGEEYFDSVKIYTVKQLHSSNKIKLAVNIMKYYMERYKLVNDILKTGKYDIIQVRNDIFDAFIAIILKRRYSIKFVFQYSFPKGAYKYLEKKSFSPYAKFEVFIINTILKKADLILPISKWMKRELILQGIPESKLYPLPMAVNIDLFSSKTGTNIRNKYEFGDNIVFVYVGSLAKIRGLEIVIEAFSRALNRISNMRLLIVGEGNDKNNLEKMVIDFGISDKVIFTGKVPYYNVSKYIAAADIGLSLIPPLPIYLISSPTKIFEYMALKKPILANEEIFEQKEVISSSNSGLLVKFDLSSIENGFIEMSYDKKNSEKGKKGYNWVKTNRTYKKMAKNLEEVYQRMLI